MKLRIKRRRDFSWPLGWLAVAVEIGAGAAVVLSLHRQQTVRWATPIILIAFVGGLIGLLATLSAVITRPRGRGWMPAVGALVLMVLMWALAIDGTRGCCN